MYGQQHGLLESYWPSKEIVNHYPQHAKSINSAQRTVYYCKQLAAASHFPAIPTPYPPHHTSHSFGNNSTCMNVTHLMVTWINSSDM